MAVEAVDLFCGAGGLTYGLRTAGIKVSAGIDLDPHCQFPIESNNPGTKFVRADVGTLRGSVVRKLWTRNSIRVLAGCAPCQPFSPYTRGASKRAESGDWSLLSQFARLVEETTPDVVTMENVPSIQAERVYKSFLATLRNGHYCVSARVADCRDYGVPQHRRRLVLLASRLGPISLVAPAHEPDDYLTVRDAIGRLPVVSAGSQHPRDRLHKARALSEENQRRIRAARPGGTWEDWPARLRAPCHRRETGRSYRNVYARMRWDAPAPTITTLSHSFGSGRFGHPEQDRAITLREAALLQSFPARYRFVPRSEVVALNVVGRLIGNAVPVRLGRAIGRSIAAHVKAVDRW
jgi:DNA (cytosine-5)-methyltransferase 1